MRSGSKPKKRPFVVAASYMAECCTKSHVWLDVIVTTDVRSAKETVRKRMKRKQFDIGDITGMEMR